MARSVVAPELAALLAGPATLVTPNRRLAASIRRRFDADRQAAGLTTWASPDILPWDAWIARLHGDLTRFQPGERVLGPAEEQAVWQQAIADSPHAGALLDTVATARLAVAAHELDIAWRLSATRGATGLSTDAEAWVQWSRIVERRCRARGWIGMAQVADRTAMLLADQPGCAPPHLIVFGFDELTPQQQDLLDVLRRIGTAIDVRQPEGLSAAVMRRACRTGADEIEAVASETRALLDRDPGLRIGVVVPDLAARRAEVFRVFDDALEPGRVLGNSAGGRPFNVSLGLPLADHPLVGTALMALRLAVGELPLTEIGALLRSPFLGDADVESSARALLDAALRERRQLTVKVATLRREAARSLERPGRGCPGLLARLRAWEPLAADARSLRQRPSAWSGTFVAMLSALGWPGERALDSEEFQTWQKWREVVSGLSGLDEVLGNLGFREALSWLSRLCADTTFQAESDAVPVQILGVLEAAGQPFDHLFVTGLHDEVWPAVARPNPFLPQALQRDRGVPHGSADWERGFAERMTAALCAGAAQVVFSHPLRDGDRDLRPSPLVAAIPLADADPDIPVRHAYWRLMRDSAHSERLADSWAPALTRPHHSTGGTNVLMDQSACPFRAFARHRLGATGLDEAGVGIDAASRGQLLHAALAALWGEVRSSGRLLALAANDVDAVVTRAVDAAWNEFRRRPRNDDLSETLIDIERQRMAHLLVAMLDVERGRPSFTVRDREAVRRFSINGLELDGRIDRIDVLPEDCLVIIDYKTGKDRPGVWGGDRPEQPQLPLYAISEDGDVGAIAFGKVRIDGVGYEGVAHSFAAFGKVEAIADSKPFAHEGEWQALIERWRARLGSLADEFLAGRADVAPTRDAITCRYCDLGPLCRIAEQGGPRDADAEAGDDDD